MANTAYEAFVEAYNNFDYRPLKGESLRKFGSSVKFMEKRQEGK